MEDFFVCYLYSGYKTTSEFLEPDEVLAILDPEGNDEISGLTGKYIILQPEKIKAILEK